MTPEHEAFIKWLENEAPFTASALRRHWEKGETYYIDTRVNLKGKRREFNRLNNAILRGQVETAPSVEEREKLVADHVDKLLGK